MGIKQEIGNRYGYLEVVEFDYIHPKRRAAFWKCRCDCGNLVSLEGSELRRKNYICCGSNCIYSRNNNKIKNLLGQKFGCLEVIKFAGLDEKNHLALWECKCHNCGEIKVFRGKDLTYGYSRSCGCVKSHGELIIKEFLNKNKIAYKSQYSFQDLLSNKGYRLFFDFGLMDKQGNLLCLIEYQGIQHFVPQENGFGDQQRNITDKLKLEYCRNKEIPLYFINYSDNIVLEIEKLCLAYNLL